MQYLRGRVGNVSPNFSPPKGRIWRDQGGGVAGSDDLLLLWSGRSEGKKGRVGEKRPAPARMARQHQCMWRDREVHWRDQTGCAMQIKTNTD